MKKKKVSARRAHVRKAMSPERFARLTAFANSTLPLALLVLVLLIGVILPAPLAALINAAVRYLEGQP